VGRNDIADNHQTSGNTNPNLQQEISELSKSIIEAHYGIDDFESRMNCPLSIILMRRGVAKKNQDPIANEPSHMTAISVDRFLACSLIAANDIAEIFRIESGRQRNGIHQITKHQCELPSLCIAGIVIQ